MAVLREQTIVGYGSVVYHRIGEIRVTGRPPIIAFVLESYHSPSSRANPATQPHRRKFEFAMGAGDVVAAAYAALLQHPDWMGASSDQAGGGTALAPAIEAGSMLWDAVAQQWVAHPQITLVERIARAHSDIDNAAGQARLRYITSVPGQAETYQRKEAEARQWAGAGFTGSPPPFIAAEADALQVSAQSVAQEIITVADYWANIKGPQIEAARRKWKVLASQCQSLPAVDSVAASAQTELDSL